MDWRCIRCRILEKAPSAPKTLSYFNSVQSPCSVSPSHKVAVANVTSQILRSKKNSTPSASAKSTIFRFKTPLDNEKIASPSFP